MEQLAYEDAVDVYERALEVMELIDEPDEARRTRLLLALGGAEASAARFADARKAFGGAADSARTHGRRRRPGRRGDRDRDAEHGRQGRRAAGRADRRGAGGDRPRADRRPRAPCSAPSRRSSTGSTPRASRRLVDEAIEIAREVDAPATLAAALHRLSSSRSGPAPPTSGWRSPTRCWRSGSPAATARRCSAPTPTGSGSYLELGDINAVDRELADYARAGRGAADAPAHLAHATRCAACGPCSTATSPRPSGWPSSRGARASAPSSPSHPSTTASS